MSVLHALRLLAFNAHCFVARSEVATRAYVGAISAVARLLPNERLRSWIRWALVGQQVPSKPLAFASRRVRIGSRTTVWLEPHLGEFDQHALFSPRLEYDAGILSWLEKHAAARYDAAIDVGANVGLYSLLLNALVSADSRLRSVYAFEPSRVVFARLLVNLARNDARSVHPFAAAVADHSGFLTFYQPEGKLTNGTLSKEFAGRFSAPSKTQTVLAIDANRLSSLFDRHDRVLLKIDVEGVEPRILAAMSSLIELHKPDIRIEVLEGIDQQLIALDCLAPYACFLFAEDRLVQYRSVHADAAHRDWLLTVDPAGLAAVAA